MRAAMAGARTSFTLEGHSIALDPRIHAVRGDLADVTLADRLFAPHYAEALERRCAVPFAALRDKPGGAQTSELLAGEAFMLLDISGGWAWGYCAHDHYVGYLEARVLGDGEPVVPLEAANAVAAAESFLGMTYLLGGRGGAGIDCSGLVQRSLVAIGIAAPRDSDMQRTQGDDVMGDLRRGDLISFEGHIGLMMDGERLIHATAHCGKVVIEPLANVTARTAIVARRRLA